jgi:antiviral helicase SKI2
MAGIVVSETISRGPPPTIEVLNMGAPDPTRQPSDILPFMPQFRKFLAPLPRSTARMSLRVVKVSVADVECITKTVVRLHGQAWNLKIQKGTVRGKQFLCDRETDTRNRGRKVSRGGARSHLRFLDLVSLG